MKRQIEERHLIQQFIQGKYYFIKNPQTDLYLTRDQSAEKRSFRFEKLNHFNLQQIWMIEEITQQTYQIIHPYSSYVLEVVQNSVLLKVNKIKNSQTFWFQRSPTKFYSNAFFIKEHKHSKKYIFAENEQLKSEQLLFQREYQNWQILPVQNHPLISQTSIIQNFQSNLVLSISQSSSKAGAGIVQSLMINSFSQRWKIIQKGNYFVIKSLKSGFVLDINGQKMKQNNNIIQWYEKDSDNQLWILQEHGKRLYLIRSKLDRQYVLGIKGNSNKDDVELIITKNQINSFWRIAGQLYF